MDDMDDDERKRAEAERADLEEHLAYIRADSRFPAEMQAALADAMEQQWAERRKRGRMIPVDPMDEEPPTT